MRTRAEQQMMPDGAGEGLRSEPLNRSKPRGYDVVNKEKRSRGREQQTGGIKARQKRKGGYDYVKEV